MQICINGELYTDDIPNFDSAKWEKIGERYNLVLKNKGEVVLTFHDIAEQDRDNYRLEGGEITTLTPLDIKRETLQNRADIDYIAAMTGVDLDV